MLVGSMTSRTPRIFTQALMVLVLMNLTWACACASTATRFSKPVCFKRLRQAFIADSQTPHASEKVTQAGSGPGPAALSLLLLHLSTMQERVVVDFAPQIPPVSAFVRTLSQGRAPPVAV